MNNNQKKLVNLFDNNVYSKFTLIISGIRARLLVKT